jgi:hypothetical protein
MNETPMLFPITPSEFWKQIRITIEEVISEKSSQRNLSLNSSLLSEKALFRPAGVCKIFEGSMSTLYQWLKQKKLKNFKVESRRYFLKTEIESLISGKSNSEINKK